MKIFVYIFSFLVFPFLGIKSQEVHFSQFYANPLLINPSLCGFFGATYRGGLNYKSQYNTFTNGYNTQVAYFDAKIFEHKRKGDNWFGLGTNVFNDVAGDGALTTQQALIAVSVHKSLNPHQSAYASLGFSGGYFEKRFDLTKLYFSSQWNGTDFDLAADQNENFYSTKTWNFDANFGGKISMKIKQRHLVYIGVSMLHIKNPIVSFDTAGVATKKQRLIIHGTALIKRKFLKLETSLYYTKQAGNYEAVGGANFIYHKLHTGIWYRSTGDLVPLVGLTHYRYRALISYDINISKLAPASIGRGGFEISLVAVIATRNKRVDKEKYDDCPSFN